MNKNCWLQPVLIPFHFHPVAAGQNTIKVQIPLEYGGSVNIDHLKVEGATSSTLSSFRNPPHFVSLITDTWPRGTGEQNLRDAQYETEAVLDHYFYRKCFIGYEHLPLYLILGLIYFLCPRCLQITMWLPSYAHVSCNASPSPIQAVDT